MQWNVMKVALFILYRYFLFSFMRCHHHPLPWGSMRRAPDILLKYSNYCARARAHRQFGREDNYFWSDIQGKSSRVSLHYSTSFFSYDALGVISIIPPSSHRGRSRIEANVIVFFYTYISLAPIGLYSISVSSCPVVFYFIHFCIQMIIHSWNNIVILQLFTKCQGQFM